MYLDIRESRSSQALAFQLSLAFSGYRHHQWLHLRTSGSWDTQLCVDIVIISPRHPDMLPSVICLHPPSDPKRHFEFAPMSSYENLRQLLTCPNRSCTQDEESVVCTHVLTLSSYEL